MTLYINDQECERLNRYKMKVEDILLGRKGDVGRAVLVTPEYTGFIVGSDIIRLRLQNADIQPDYLYYFLLAPKTRSWIARYASGTTMPGINEKLLNRMRVPIPPKTQQSKAVRTFVKMNAVEETMLLYISAASELLHSIANDLTTEVT